MPTIGESVEWSGLGLAGGTKRNIRRNGVLVGCIREDSVGFSIRADARGDHCCARVGQTYFGLIHKCISWNCCRSVYWFRCYRASSREGKPELLFRGGLGWARDGCLPWRAWS